MKRLDCLDGLRGALAMYVLLTHMAPFAALPTLVAVLLSHGEAGVDLFFMLSGLVIVRSIEHFDYHARPFLIARAARIFPTFLPVFALAVAVQPLPVNFARMPWIGPDSTARMIWSDGWPASWCVDLPAHVTMLHGLFPNGALPDVWVSFLGAAWSLSTEWQFYSLVALVGAHLGCGGRGLWRLSYLLLALAGIAGAWHAIAPPDWQFSRAFLPNKAQYFALGVASAALLRGAAGRLHFLAVLTAVLVLCVMRENPFKVLPPIAWVMCLGAQVAQTRSGSAWYGLRMIGAALSSAALRWLGAVSYCLYLVNEPLQKLLGVMLAIVVQDHVTVFSVVWVPGAVLLPVLAAWWLHMRIELPALRRGRVLAEAALGGARFPVLGSATYIVAEETRHEGRNGP